MKRASIFCALVSAILLFSCIREDDFDTDPGLKLEFSNDSVVFDTVFTTIGSATRYLMVYNPGKKPVRISSIRLEGSYSSMFRMNVDGDTSGIVRDAEIDGNDSMFIFLKVRIDPANQNSPLVVTDKILFLTNGNAQEVLLVAWGQDAHYIVGQKHQANLPPYKIVAGENEHTTWVNDKPYVVYGYAVVDSTGSLSVEKGVQVHFHDGSGLWVYKGGAIKVNGTLDEPVMFQGDRLEQPYQDIPGQWDRIWLNESSVDNVFNYAIIQNGYIGIQAETLEGSMGNQLTLSNTIIRNMTGWGIFTRFYKIDCWNTEVTNCGLDVVYLSTGGDYRFRHCTLGNYWNNSIRQTPALLVSNYYYDSYSQVTYLGDLSRAFFGNCIIYGNQEDELLLDKADEPVAFNYSLDHCLIKVKLLPDSAVNCWKNQDPMFEDIEKWKYTLQKESPAIGKGDPSISSPIPFDYFGTSRLPEPDLGAYQYKEE